MLEFISQLYKTFYVISYNNSNRKLSFFILNILIGVTIYEYFKYIKGFKAWLMQLKIP